MTDTPATNQLTIVPKALNLEPELGVAQQDAFDAAMAGKTMLISGPGGVGKSEVTRRIVRAIRGEMREIAVTGSTGMAAVNIGGTTIHSCLGTGPFGSTAELRKKMGNEAVSRAQDRIGTLSAILIDEVSMLTGDYLDMMDWWLNLVRQCPTYVPFGGVQVILVGDFLQLPPVIQSFDRVNRRFAFQAKVWEKANPEVFLLKKNYRQTGDDDFKKHLKRVRRGHMPMDTLSFFNERLNAKLPGGVEPTRLFPTNKEVDGVNLDRLDALPGKEWDVPASFTGHPKWIEALQKSVPCPDPLSVKPGAEVVFIRNHRGGHYVNGSRGIVLTCDAAGIIVRLRNGVEVKAERDKWEMKDSKEKVLASCSQFPLKLAWALSIHKSQGQTLDEIELDPCRMFEQGQCYTALSRVRTIGGLRLLTRLKMMHVKTSDVVVEWYKKQVEQIEQAANG